MSRPHAPRRLARSLLSSLTLALTLVAIALGDLGVAATASAVSEPAEAEPSEEEVPEELVAPFALYPDELLSVVLPASTYPLQIVQASRFLEKRKTDPSLQPDEGWDPSILALLNYPDVLAILNEDLDWTWTLGEAVAAQQEAVMAAIQRFRARVDAAGNLDSDEKRRVTRQASAGDTQQIIVIESASPEVIYVPVYQPATVVIHHVTPYPWYYSSPYPYYYHPTALFWSGMFVGSAIAYSVHWNQHRHHHGHHGGRINVHRNVNLDVNRNFSVQRDPGRVWRPDTRRGRQHGARPSVSRHDQHRRGDRARTDTGPAVRRRSPESTAGEPDRRRTRRETGESRTRENRRSNRRTAEEATPRVRRNPEGPRGQRRTPEEATDARPTGGEPRVDRQRTREDNEVRRSKREEANAEPTPEETGSTPSGPGPGEVHRRDREASHSGPRSDRSHEGRSEARRERSSRGSVDDSDRGARSRRNEARSGGRRGDDSERETGSRERGRRERH